MKAMPLIFPAAKDHLSNRRAMCYRDKNVKGCHDQIEGNRQVINHKPKRLRACRSS